MSYVQGSIVRLRAVFHDEDTGEAYQPPNVIFTVKDGDGTTTQYTLADNEVTEDGDNPGTYFMLLDTSPAFGTYVVQVESDDLYAAVERKTLNVRSRIDA